ncbi:uncharacterized protein [Sinocyclocheilus grahami]|uniref:uncharacterized protein n=1 Tax=Sinocyclocheilus grahami TaxID=75366 RepID=UPI0007ACF69F|nr:PREDICTED: uncharacterized protein LOC107571191 [Sinocyclocheilus grahami]
MYFKCVFGDTYALKAVSVMEGESVTLHTDREMRNNDRILWRFGPENTLIAEINVVDSSMTVNDDSDGRFRGRMKVDRQTGCLTITNTRIEHAGCYELQTNPMKKFFILTVYGAVGDRDEMKSVSVMEGNSVTLHTDTEMRNNDLIQWMFGNYLIAEIKETANGITIYDGVLEGRFRDRLQVDEETGSLTFTNARIEHTGFYQLQTNHTKKVFTLGVYGAVRGCDTVQAVIRLVVTALVGVAAVAAVVVLYYDIRSRRAEHNQAHSPISAT